MTRAILITCVLLATVAGHCKGEVTVTVRSQNFDGKSHERFRDAVVSLAARLNKELPDGVLKVRAVAGPQIEYGMRPEQFAVTSSVLVLSPLKWIELQAWSDNSSSRQKYVPIACVNRKKTKSPFYSAVLVVNADSPLTKLSDLQRDAKTLQFNYMKERSASGNLGPLILLASTGIIDGPTEGALRVFKNTGPKDSHAALVKTLSNNPNAVVATWNCNPGLYIAPSGDDKSKRSKPANREEAIASTKPATEVANEEWARDSSYRVLQEYDHFPDDLICISEDLSANYEDYLSKLFLAPETVALFNSMATPPNKDELYSGPDAISGFTLVKHAPEIEQSYDRLKLLENSKRLAESAEKKPAPWYMNHYVLMCRSPLLHFLLVFVACSALRKRQFSGVESLFKSVSNSWYWCAVDSLVVLACLEAGIFAVKSDYRLDRVDPVTVAISLVLGVVISIIPVAIVLAKSGRAGVVGFFKAFKEMHEHVADK